MTSTGKRKSSLSPSRNMSSGRKRHHAQPVTNMKPIVAPALTTPFIDRVPRPKRWRKSVKNTEGLQPAVPSIHDSSQDGSFRADKSPSPKQGSIKLRFSFTSYSSEDEEEEEREEVDDSEEDEPRLEGLTRQQPINTQLSPVKRPPPTSASHPQLPVRDSGRTASDPAVLPFSSSDAIKKKKKREGYGFSYSEAPFNHSFITEGPDPQLIIPVSTPPKQREGYGFSFSDTLFYDSDEYPDTICGDLSYQNDLPSTPTPEKKEKGESSTSIQNPIIKPDSSFAEVVVMRDVGSFHLAKPQRSLACTSATREDTIRLKASANALFKYDESPDIYGGLISRLENMVRERVERANGNGAGGAIVATITSQCAMRLRDFLLSVKRERVETGEARLLVEHEIEWVRWLVEASYAGVIHLKTPECTCKPDWEGYGE